MKLKDCLEADVTVSAPLLRKEPGESWKLAYKKGFIPESLYKFYVAVDYFSLDKCPNFLNDTQNILFPHLEAATEIVKSSFEDYYELIDLMKKYDKDSYTPVKEIKRETFNKHAIKLFNRCFQILMINMYSILDSTAESIAIILSWGKLGRGKFSALVKDTRDSLSRNNNISSVKIISLEDKYIKDIQNVLKKDIIAEHNNEWYKLFKLYRNKQAHFRRYSGFLLHDKECNFYHFLPREWPYYFQQDISYAKNVKSKANNNLQKSLSELLIEQDIFEYCDGLCKKIYNLTNHIFIILTEAYKIKKDTRCDINSDIQKQILSLRRRYKFRSFNKEYSVEFLYMVKRLIKILIALQTLVQSKSK